MMKNLFLYIIFPLLLSACNNATSDNNRSTAGDIKPTNTSIVWLANGETLLVGNKWLYTFNSRHFTELTHLPKQVKGKPEQWQAYPFVQTNHILWFDHKNQLLVPKKDNEQYSLVKIPMWIKSKPEFKERLNNLVVSKNKNEIYVQQYNTEPSLTVVCAVYNTKSTQWRIIANRACVPAEFVHVYKIQHIDDIRMAVYSSGEGVNGLNIVSSDPAQFAKQKEITTTLDLGYVTPLHVSAINKNNITTVLSCEMIKATINTCTDNTKGAVMYTWKLDTNKLSPSLKNIPHDVYFSTKSERYAWIENNKLCIYSIANNTQTCEPIP